MTGYRGRFSIVEVLTMNPELERRIGAGATADSIAEAARHTGMQSLWESGLVHVLNGETTLEELLRVTDVPHDDRGGWHRARADAGAVPGVGPAAGAAADRSRQQRRGDAASPGIRRGTDAGRGPLLRAARRSASLRSSRIPRAARARAAACCWWRTRTSFAG